MSRTDGHICGKIIMSTAKIKIKRYAKGEDYKG